MRRLSNGGAFLQAKQSGVAGTMPTVDKSIQCQPQSSGQ
jgi:hypothetical protein